jgi:dTDP-4-amino-4,6-dideoxygalactose transaminase
MVKVLSADMPSLKSVLPILERIHNSGIFSNYGPVESLYRKKIAALLKVDDQQIVTCANATIGIQGICSILDFDEWGVQNWTFPATGLAVQNSGNTISLIDVSLQTWTVDSLTADSREGGLISTIPFGASVSRFLANPRAFHIFDAAASLGNFDDLSNLKKNMAVVVSLHATKILGCGEGGLVIFGDAELAKEFRSWANFGFSGERDSRIFGATNGKLSEISCAFALANLQEFSEKKYRYIELRKKVNSISRDLGILPEVMDDNRVSPYWIVHFESIERRNLVERILNESGVETRRWWPKPLSQMPAFSGEQFESAAEVNSSYLAGTTLGLPFHLKLSDLDIHEIASRLESALV